MFPWKSSSGPEPKGRVDVGAVVAAMMPLYYDDKSVAGEDIERCKITWDKVLSGTAPGAAEAQRLLLKCNGVSASDAGADLFRALFFRRFFDVHHAAEAKFSDAAIQSGRFIGGMISMCFSQLADDKGFRRSLVIIAEDHCQRGVRCIEYGIVGEVLLWTLNKMLGPDYTRAVEQAWVRLFSSVLRVIVPIAVTFEHENRRIVRSDQHTPL